MNEMIYVSLTTNKGRAKKIQRYRLIAQPPVSNRSNIDYQDIKRSWRIVKKLGLHIYIKTGCIGLICRIDARKPLISTRSPSQLLENQSNILLRAGAVQN
jgi:hypothetical protein